MSIASTWGFRSMSFFKSAPGSKSRSNLSRSTRKSGSKYRDLGYRSTTAPTRKSATPTARHACAFELDHPVH